MIPSRRWFPGTLAERAAWFANFSSQFSTLATTLGFVAAEVTAVTADNAMMQFLNQATVEIDAYKEAVRQFRIGITEGNTGAANSQFPANPDLTPPASVPTGIFERLDDLVKRIRVAPSFTDEIGALLGILASHSEAPAPATLKPIIKATDAFSGYTFTLNVTKMGMDSFKVQIRRMDSDSWHEAGFGTTSPMNVTVKPTAPGQPERIQIRAQLMKKNQPVGEPSDAVYVTVNP